MKNILVSVIVPVYNVDSYLVQCLESIIKQTYKNLEVILVDDGSTDESGSICDVFSKKDSRIKVIHRYNGGLSSARNAGLEIATGDYISFIDSDDFVENNFIETLLDLCQRYNVGIACLNYKEISGKGVSLTCEDGNEVLLSDTEFLIEINNSERKHNITYCVWTKLFRRDIIQDLIFPVGKVYEDVMYTTRALFNSKGGVFKNISLYNYRIREGSISKSKYKEGFDRRLLTDRLLLQIEQLEFVKENISEQLYKILKFGYFEEMYNLRGMNLDKSLSSSIDDALMKFILSLKDIMELPYNNKRKIKGAIKMMMQSILYRLHMIYIGKREI